MDTKEDTERDQNEGTTPPENDDRNSPQNPSHNPSPYRRYINRGINAAENYANDPRNASGNQNQGKGGLNRLRNQFTKGAGGPAGSNPAVDKLKSTLGLSKKQGGSRTQQLKNKGKEIAKEKGKQIAEQIAKRAAALAVENPYVIVGIVVILFILFLIIFIMGGTGNALQNQNGPKLTITKTGPDHAEKAGDPLPYQISISYPGSAQDITVTDHIPDGTDFDPSTPPPAHYDAGTRTVTWSTKEAVPPVNGLISNVSTTFTLSLKATADNAFIVNQAEGSVIGAVSYNQPGGNSPGGPPAEGFVPHAPESNNCNGKYDFSKYPDQNPLGNYGDPQCNFSKDALYKLLQSKESNPEFVHIWFDIIIPGESNFDPNEWAPPVGQQGELDSGGAWGLYQMGSSTPPGQSPPAPGQNGVYDRGDVNWELQTSNAYNDWKTRNHCNFYPYWGTYQRSGEPNVNHC